MKLYYFCMSLNLFLLLLPFHSEAGIVENLVAKTSVHSVSDIQDENTQNFKSKQNIVGALELFISQARAFITQGDFTQHAGHFAAHSKSSDPQIKKIVTDYFYTHLFNDMRSYSDPLLMLKLCNEVISTCRSDQKLLFASAMLGKIDIFRQHPDLVESDFLPLNELKAIASHVAYPTKNTEGIDEDLCRATCYLLLGIIYQDKNTPHRDNSLSVKFLSKAQKEFDRLIEQDGRTQTEYNGYTKYLKIARSYLKQLNTLNMPGYVSPENSELYLKLYRNRLINAINGISRKPQVNLAFTLMQHPLATDHDEAIALLYLAEYYLKENDVFKAGLYAHALKNNDELPLSYREHADDVLHAIGELPEDEIFL